MADLGNLTVHLRADMKDLSAKLKKATSGIKKFTSGIGKQLRKASEMFVSLGKAVGRFASTVGKKIAKTMKVVVIAIAAASAAAVKFAMDAQESENLFTVSMGKMATSARKWSKEVSNALGMNEFEVRKNIATFNVMLNSMGLTENQAFDMSKAMTQLTLDMASFYNLRHEEAFLKLQSGLSGEIEPLKRLGILVNENTIKTWALTNGMIRQGEVMTEQQKVVARYNVILDQTNKAQGDMERTVDDSTNVLRAVGSQIKMVSIDIGMSLIPQVEKVGIAFRDWLVGNRKNIEEFSKKGIDKLGDFVDFFKNDWKDGLLLAGKITSRIFEGMVEMFGVFGKKAADAFKREFGASFGAWMVEVGKPEGLTGKLSMLMPGVAAGRLGLMKAGTDLMQSSANQKIHGGKKTKSVGDIWKGVGTDIKGMLPGPSGFSAGIDPGFLGFSAGLIPGETKSAGIDPGFLGFSAGLIPGETKKGGLENVYKQISGVAGGGQTDLKAVESIRKITDAINEELQMVGRLNQARFRSRDLVELQIAAEKAYGAQSSETIKLLSEYGKKLKELEAAQRLAQIADSIGDSFANAFEKAIFGAEKFETVMISMLQEISKEIIKTNIMGPLAQGISTGLQGFGASLFAPKTAAAASAGFVGPMQPMGPPTAAGAYGVMHAGGIVGAGSASRRFNPSIFSNAPRFHSGLAGDEFPTVLQRGERVLPKENNGPMVEVNVINKSSQPVNAEQGQASFDGRGYVTEIILRDMSENGPVTQGFKGLGR